MSEAQQQSILVIVAEDCGYGDLGCTGQTNHAILELNPLAAEGMRFVLGWAKTLYSATGKVWRC